MKTIIIDDKKIQISDESYEAFKKQFVAKDKAILWKPEDGDMYWFIGVEDDCQTINWNSDGVDQYAYEIGNTFKTRGEAEEALETGWIAKRKAEVRILRFIAENDLEYAWRTNESNYGIRYSHRAREFYPENWYQDQHSTLPYFKSEEDAQKLIDAMTPELKILFGVK